MEAGHPLILGYHGIDAISARHDPIGLYVSPQALTQHVRRLLSRGYQFLRMREVAEFIDGSRELDGPVAALTFDDGTSDHSSVLPGVLEELGVPGTVYVCPELADEPYPWAHGTGVRFMSKQQIVELAANPLFEIGSHTNTHEWLGDADEETALREMVDCKRNLETMLGTEILSFCYPRCAYSEAAREAAPRAGYTTAVTCGMRGSWDPFELRREVMHNQDGPLVTRFKLRGRYSRLGTGLAGRGIRGGAILTDRLVGRASARRS